MKLERLTLIRANIGNYRSKDAMPPLSIAILTARTPNDIKVQFYDDKVETLPEDDDPDLMAMTVETFTARRAYQIADRYRAKGIPVVMGGYHPTFLPEEALRHADAVVIGDAEGSWERVLDDFRNGRMQQRYVGGNQRPLDDFVLDRDIFRGKKYVPVIPVQYGRGCRFACNFCSIRAFYQDDLRTRAPHQLATELRSLQTKKLVFFVDDNLFNSTPSLTALLDAIQPLGIRWSCQISIDVARDERLLDRIAEAGCVVALVGFESLSEANLKQMGKPWNRVAGDYRSVVKRFDERGIAVYGTFVFGYDSDTAETIQQCLDFAMEAKLGIANFNPLTPTPGSPLYDQLAREQRLLSPQWWLDENYRYGDAIFIPKSMSPAEFAQKCFQAKQTFYSWTSIAQRVLYANGKFDWFRSGMLGLANIVSRKEVLRKQHRALGV